jgi:chromosome segregation ATPase
MATKKDSDLSGIHIEGGVHAGRDVILGDQYNYGLRDERIAQIASPDEFRKALAEIQAQIAHLKQQPELSAAQKRNIEAAENQVTVAVEEAQKPKASGSKIKEALTDAKDTFDLISGGLEAAVKLGSTLAPIIGLAIKLFGG